VTCDEHPALRMLPKEIKLRIYGRLVKLEWYELFLGAILGLFRTIESRYRGEAEHKEIKGVSLKGIFEQVDINAGRGELALGKATDRYVRLGINTSTLPDVSNVMEARRAEPGGRLIVRDRDKDDRMYFLVYDLTPYFVVVGFMQGKDAKQAKYIDDPNEAGRPIYMVPPEDLMMISEKCGRIKGVEDIQKQGEPVGAAYQ
jgi:hypothetical protein